MSAGKVRKLSRQLNYTATWSAGILTVVTVVNHYLLSGTTVNLHFSNVPQDFIGATVTVVNPTTFTTPLADANQVQSSGIVVIKYYSVGIVGPQAAFSLPKSTSAGTIIQSTVTGTGGATYTLEVSLDSINWIAAFATITHSVTSGDTQFITVNSAWAYGRINPSVIGAATSLSVSISG